MTRILLAALLTAFAGVAAAQTVTIAADTGEADTAQTAETSPAPREPARVCMRSTGSRILAAQNARAEKEGKPQRCANSAGRSYTAEELERTGHMDLSSALRSIDTSLR